ncbi:MAG: PLP-dependent transferase [Planctomycetaceae bacterium]
MLPGDDEPRIDDARRPPAGRISERTIRVSVGIEDPEDLVADMRQALE